MFEIKIVEGSREHLQKILNQWKHSYTIEVTAFTYKVEDIYCIIIKRTPK